MPELDKYGNCDACGPEGCMNPRTHYTAGLLRAIELLDQKEFRLDVSVLASNPAKSSAVYRAIEILHKLANESEDR